MPRYLVQYPHKCAGLNFLRRWHLKFDHLDSENEKVWKSQIGNILRISICLLTAVTWNESTQATESSVAVGPAVVNVSKSNLGWKHFHFWMPTNKLHSKIHMHDRNNWKTLTLKNRYLKWENVVVTSSNYLNHMAKFKPVEHLVTVHWIVVDVV